MNTNKQHPAGAKAKFAVRPVVAAVALAMASLSHAQQAAPAGKEEVKLETVVVTANKRAQNLQDVPMAITVLNDAVLQRNNVKDFDDLPALSPALSVSYSTQPGNFSINMRGIGTYSLGIGVESDVSVIIDDVPYAMQANAFKDLADVNRIEVLKGPQSTLFGKSSIAGAVNISTKPIDSIWKTKASTLLTSDGEWRASTSVSGALSDTVRMRLAAGKTSFGGVVKNLYDGGKLNGSRDTNLSGKLEWTPDDNWTVVFSPRASKFTKACCVQPFNSMSNFAGAVYNLNNGTTYAAGGYMPASQVLKGIVPGPDNVSVRNDYPAGGKARDVGAGLKVSYAFGEDSVLAKHTLTSVTSWSHYKMNDYQDGDATDSDVLGKALISNKLIGVSGGLYQYGLFDVKAKTQELRMTSPDKSSVRYVAGLWYGKNELARELTRAPVTTYVTDYGATAYNTNYAIFGQGSFDLTPQTSVVAGLRYNKEDTGYSFSRYNPPPATSRVLTEYFHGDDTEKKATGKIGLEHRLDPATMAYATYSTGHKGKAYDLTSSFNAAIAKTQPVPGEDAKSIEAGVKMSLLNNRMSLDLAVFRTNFTGFQQSAGFTDADGIFRTTLHSIGGLRTSGFESDLNWRVSRELLLNGSFAYTKAIVTSFENGPCYSVLNAAGTGTTPGGNCAANPKYNNTNVADLAGKTLPNAPKFKLNLGGQYDILTDRSYNGFVTTAFRWQSKTQFNLNQDPMTEQGGYGIVNLGAGIKDKKDGFKLSFMVNNVFNKSYATGLANTWVNGTWTAKAPNPVAIVNTTSWTPARDYQRYFSVRADMQF
ncbi:TonB-dependent receptor [Pseudoduganella aquatica]|uniref:TonB-dependent receptor n=1 Tax=Pseudoduganella aquatica TaxID=2660641 RepID=UPI001E43B69C|nr:TonB-dependent receptor [Pseudoduganella aquatica]